MIIRSTEGFLSTLIVILLVFVTSSRAQSETTAIIALSVFVAIPSLFILTCCCSLFFVFHYRHKIPIFKSFMRNAKKGSGTSGARNPVDTKAAAPPPQYAPQPGAMPPPGATPTPDAPPGERPPGQYEMENPVQVDDVVIPIKKE